MFDLDPDRRISFSDIRRHPVFSKYFAVVSEASKILYSKKFKQQPSKIMKKADKKMPVENNNKLIEEEDNIRGTMSVIRKKDKEYPQ